MAQLEQIKVNGVYYHKIKKYEDPERIKIININKKGTHAFVKKYINESRFNIPISQIIVSVDDDTLKRIEKRDNALIEKKNLKKARRKQRAEELLAQRYAALAAIGITSDEKFIELLEDEEIKIVAKKQTGYPSTSDSFDACSDKDAMEETHYLGEYNGHYITWFDPAYVNEGSSGVCGDELQAWNSLEEAQEYLDGLTRYPPANEVADGILKQLGSERYRIITKYNHFNIYYKGCLIVENLYSYDMEKVKEGIADLMQLKEKCKIKGLKIEEIKKEPKIWNDNQRYYKFVFVDEHYNRIPIRVHIPAASQHNTRCPAYLLLVDGTIDKLL